MALTRSQQMSRIPGRHTRPERILRALLWRMGLRYRLHFRTPAGRPDLVFPNARLAVFIDGCFWHGCPDHYVRPRSSPAFWATKLQENVRRDIEQTRELERHGWRVCRVWEHDVFEQPEHIATKIGAALRATRWRPGVSWRVYRVDPITSDGSREQRHLRDLRRPEVRRCLTRARSTRKWRRPKSHPLAVAAPLRKMCQQE